MGRRERPRAGRRPPSQHEAVRRAGEASFAARGRASSWEEVPPLPARGRASSWGGGVPPPARSTTSQGGEGPPLGVSVGFNRGGFSDFVTPTEKIWDDLPPYLEGYSLEHIAAIMSLPKCPSFDSGEDLEDLSDFELNSTELRRSEQCDDIASDGAAGSKRCETDDEVISEDEETESEGEEVESESEEAEVTEVSARSSVVVELGVDRDGHSGVPGYRILRCRTVDIGTCDSVLTREQLAGIRVTYRVPSVHKFILPSRGRRIRDPPAGCFTVYIAYFDNGFSILPHPLLVKVIRSYGICVSQLMQNSVMCFEGWRRRLLELGLLITLESFHALWTVRRMAEVSDSSDDGRYFYFTPQKACRFLAGFVSSKGPWKEKFFYVRDDGKKLEIDIVRARKAAVREQKRRDQESAPPQVGSSVSVAPHGVSTGSGHSGSLLTPMALVVSTAAKNRWAARLAEMKRLEAALEQRQGDFSRRQEERDEVLGNIVSWERRFEREKSEEFETILTDRAIYDDAIRRCRRVLRRTLREKGRIVEEDIGLLDLEVSEGEEEVVEVAEG
ncbi:UNVERIFIED_CONTAM: hypothetical protein Sindi_0958600 [Sesamum indicum]